MAETTIRWACVERILELAREHELLRGDDTTVASIWPGDEAGVECIYLADLDGELTVPVSRDDQRVTYDDKFTITWAVELKANGRDPDELMARADVLLGALQDVIAMRSQLGKLDGVVSARLGEQNGPLGVEFRGVGLMVVARQLVNVHARLSS